MKLYNPLNKTWSKPVKLNLTASNHMHSICEECAKEKGVKYYYEPKTTD